MMGPGKETGFAPPFPWPLQKKRTMSKQTLRLETTYMAFFTSSITILQTLVVALGAGLAVWGVINLLEGYGNDNPGANAHVW